MISFVIPAYNEEHLIGATVRQLHDSARGCGIGEYEILVVDDASSDATAAVAQAAGARVVPVRKRQIAAARNAGAAAARGEVLIFVDADTLVPEQTLQRAVDVLADGAVGGGALVRFRGEVPRWSHIGLAIFQGMLRMTSQCGGCFMFVQRSHFDAIGGFDERLFASEELTLAKMLKRRGRFVVLDMFTLTSGRKLRMYSMWKLLRLMFQAAIPGSGVSVRRREGLDLWYDGQREGAGKDVC
jgi:glycosyltransferase involved in cell wall biosynthesis